MRRMFIRWLAGSVGFLMAWAALAAAGGPGAAGPPKLLTIQSQSGQFLVQGPPQILPSPAFINHERRTNFVLLDQASLAVWCDRIKQSLLRELAAPDRWKGRIVVNLYRAADLGEPVYVTAQWTPNGWFYRLDVPSEVHPERLNRTVVAVLLQEMADRQAGPRPAELPPWLGRGLAAHLELYYGASFRVTPEPGQRDGAVMRVERRVEPLAAIRARLQGQPPPGLDEMNWPAAPLLDEPPGGYYENCSHLLVLSLLRLPDGPALLRRMIQDCAARHLNWHTGFLQAYGAFFPTLREADKWWAVQVAAFTGRDQAHLYSLAESWRKLEEILECPVQVKGEDGRMQRGVVNLQTVINQWDYGRQKPVLRQKAGQLQLLRARVAPQLLRLTEDYTRTLQGYLSRRDRAVLATDAQAMTTDSPRTVARRAVLQLEQLDALRAELKTAPPPAPVVAKPDTAAPAPR